MERKDWWFLLLKQELTSHRIALNPRFIISVFCRTPLHIPFPPLRRPLLLSKELLKDIRGLKVSNYRRVDVRFDQQPREGS
ncbi:hypothetical protein YC2023_062042 [Brassica napus]